MYGNRHFLLPLQKTDVYYLNKNIKNQPIQERIQSSLLFKVKSQF